MVILIILLFSSGFANAKTASDDSTEPQTATAFFSLLNKIKNSYNQTLANLTQMNEQLNINFLQTKNNKVKNAKRLAFISSSYDNLNLCPCMLRTPCITRRIEQEPLDETILQQYSEKLDKDLRFYLYDFGNPQ